MLLSKAETVRDTGSLEPGSMPFFGSVSVSEIHILCIALKQGSDLIDLRLTWREMENLIFGRFMRIFGGFLSIIGDFCGILEKLVRC